jgi:hypothetical protein
MINVQYPEPQFRIKKKGEKQYIFDVIRKKWLVLTSEEWVRQNFISFLVSTVNCPLSFLALEKEFELNGLKKRFDILIYDKGHQPWMLVECKEPNVPLSEEVLQQVLRYNISTPATYIVITNGEHTIGWRKNGEHLQLLEELPDWTG